MLPPDLDVNLDKKMNIDNACVKVQMYTKRICLNCVPVRECSYNLFTHNKYTDFKLVGLTTPDVQQVLATPIYFYVTRFWIDGNRVILKDYYRMGVCITIRSPAVP